jgi:hypothetical protein
MKMGESTQVTWDCFVCDEKSSVVIGSGWCRKVLKKDCPISHISRNIVDIKNLMSWLPEIVWEKMQTLWTMVLWCSGGIWYLFAYNGFKYPSYL